MGSLQSFLQAARERVAAGAYARVGPRLKPNGSLVAALKTHPTPVIAELKPRSPSAGRLLTGDAGRTLAAYKAGGAAALSILTDATHFDGSPALLSAAHATRLPTLMKDFIVSVAQIDCAAHQGASAVLLIERSFRRPADREHLVAAAHARGLEVLLELHDTRDWQRAAASKAELIGVNARDLDTLAVDPAKALRLLAEVARARPVVALSGVDGRAAYRQARRAGAVAALVGTHLLRSADARLALLALQRPLAKVCGLRTLPDVAAAADAGADLIGLVVGSPDSPRDLAPALAQRLAEAARERGLASVLVTRTTDAARLLEWSRLVRPDFLQLHGATATAELRQLLAAVPTRVLAAVAPGAPAPTEADGVIVDTAPAGGSGTAHAWRAVPTSGLSFIAGGLDASNAGQALAASGAWGADASSALESSPGHKDAAKVHAFVQAVHAA